LIETPHPNLSQTIKWINVGYSMYFNRKRRRFGHLFQGRFKAVLVDADEYLKHLGETSVAWATGSISPELESRLGMNRSPKNLVRIESLRGRRIESEVKY